MAYILLGYVVGIILGINLNKKEYIISFLMIFVALYLISKIKTKSSKTL